MNVVRRLEDGKLIEFTIDGVSQSLPSITMQVGNLARAVGKAVLNPSPVSKEERERRLAICHACEFLIDGKRCSKCGCHVNWKARLEAWHCPISRW